MTCNFRSFAFALALLLVGAVTTVQAETGKVRIGIGYALSYVPIYVAQEKGFFKEEGIEVEFVKIEIVPDMIQSIIGGSTDAGIGGSFGIITFMAKGAPISAVSVYAYGGDRLAVMARKGAGVRTLKDLYGKRVAVQTGTTSHQLWETLLKAERLDPSKFAIKNIRNVDLPAAVAAESVDALVSWEPTPTVLKDRGLVDVIKRGGQYLKSYGCVIFGNKFLEENPDTVRRFVKAQFRAAKFIRDNPREASIINAKYNRNVPAETLERSARYMVFDPRMNQAAIDDLDGDIKFMRASGRVTTKLAGKDLVIARFSDEIERAHPELTADLDAPKAASAGSAANVTAQAKH